MIYHSNLVFYKEFYNVIIEHDDECSKPFNTPKILGCINNLNDIIE